MTAPTPSLRRRLVESLYVETMLLADEARSYFDHDARMEREWMTPASRISLSVESLRATTRLLHLVSWLLARRAVEVGEIGEEEEARSAARRLQDVQESPEDIMQTLPDEARAMITATMELLRRGMRLQDSIEAPVASGSPAHDMLERLAKGF